MRDYIEEFDLNKTRASIGMLRLVKGIKMIRIAVWVIILVPFLPFFLLHILYESTTEVLKKIINLPIIIFDKIWINELKFIYNLAPHVKFIRECLKDQKRLK